MTSILIIEPDPIRRAGLLACLTAGNGATLAGVGARLLEALQDVASREPPDVVVLNADPPEYALPAT